MIQINDKLLQKVNYSKMLIQLCVYKVYILLQYIFCLI